MRKLTVRDADGSEKIIWREILRSRDSRYDHRLHGVLAVCRGLSCYRTAAIWGRSPRAVEYWVKRFHDDGVSALREKRRPGRPRSLSAQQMEYLHSDLRRGPQSVGREERRWTGRSLRAHLGEYYGVDLTVRHCQRLIREVQGREEAAAV